MRKAINTFFGDESTEVSLDEMDTTEIRMVMKMLHLLYMCVYK